MAETNGNVVTRTIARIFRFLGVTSSSERADQGLVTPADNANYGAFSPDELRHLAGLSISESPLYRRRPVPQEHTIMTYLEQVSDNTHTKIEELKNLTIVAPEIKMAKRVVCSTIMSPQDLQTNKVNITMEYEGLSEDVKNKILEKLNSYFNSEYHFAAKLFDWLQCAGFEEGAKAVLVLPKHELDVQNVISDVLVGHENLGMKECIDRIKESDSNLYYPIPDRGSTEAIRQKVPEDLLLRKEMLDEFLDAEIEAGLDDLGVDDFLKENYPNGIRDDASEDKKVIIKTKKDMSKLIREGTFKLLNRNGDGTVVVTRDLSPITKNAGKTSEKLEELLKDAKAQMTGFDPNDKNCQIASAIRCYSISDTIKIGKDDLPIVIEIPSDAVIPVCAPRDNTNHIGYFILVDENGQPISGNNNYFKTGSTDVTNRLAMSAAKGVYGNATLTSFSELSTNPQIVLQQMEDVFAVAVNKLLESKLRDDGLTGLNVNVHNAVGKALFLNLLANNRIRMIFVPEPMLVYYRFDHRKDGTGKTLLEDSAQLLALRTTFMIARLMAAIDNATLHRTIEVDLDEKDTNPAQTMQMLVRQAVSKYTPSFSTEVQTAAESLVSRNLSVKPKSMAGTTDNLSVNIDKSYGNSQAPDTDLMDKLNNWIGMGIGGLPASVLNQLGENEFSRSVATTNMYFANSVAGWQMAIQPYNKKFIANYVSSCSRLVDMIRDSIKGDKDGEPKNLKENQSSDVEDDKLETAVKDIIQSLDVSLPPPQMAVKKAQFEEIQSFSDMIEKIVGIIYSDDIVVDDELKGNMNVIRAAITSKLLREFLPKLGCNAIADIPEPRAIDANYARDVFLYLSNIKRRIKNLADLAKGTLPSNKGDSSAGTQPEETPPEESSSSGEEQASSEPEEGGEEKPGEGMF